MKLTPEQRKTALFSLAIIKAMQDEVNERMAEAKGFTEGDAREFAFRLGTLGIIAKANELALALGATPNEDGTTNDTLAEVIDILDGNRRMSRKPEPERQSAHDEAALD